MKIFKTGIIGCGRIGSQLEEDPLRGKPCTHTGGFSALPNIKIVAGCDIDRNRLKKFGQKWKVKKLYTDYHDMLRDNALDILCIATWTNQHATMALDGVRAGVKGIFCEKPIDVDIKLARKLVRTCKQKNISLLINHERRWDAYYQKAHKLIQAGKIGEIRTIIGNALSWKPGTLPVSQYGGGPLFHDGTHLIDLLLYFGGPIKWVSGHETRSKGKRYIEETACAMIGFQNNMFSFCLARLIDAKLLALNSDSSSFKALDKVSLYSLFFPNALFLKSLSFGASPLSLRVALCSANFLFSKSLVGEKGLDLVVFELG
mgnify:CR=1 FL=1